MVIRSRDQAKVFQPGQNICFSPNNLHHTGPMHLNLGLLETISVSLLRWNILRDTQYTFLYRSLVLYEELGFGSLILLSFIYGCKSGVVSCVSVGFIVRQQHHFHWVVGLVVDATVISSRFPFNTLWSSWNSCGRCTQQVEGFKSAIFRAFHMSKRSTTSFLLTSSHKSP